MTCWFNILVHFHERKSCMQDLPISTEKGQGRLKPRKVFEFVVHRGAHMYALWTNTSKQSDCDVWQDEMDFVTRGLFENFQGPFADSDGVAKRIGCSYASLGFPGPESLVHRRFLGGLSLPRAWWLLSWLSERDRPSPVMARYSAQCYPSLTCQHLSTAGSNFLEPRIPFHTVVAGHEGCQ